MPTVSRGPRISPAPRPGADWAQHHGDERHSGVAQDAIADFEEYTLRLKARLNALYARHCGRSLEEVERTLDRG